MDTIEYRKVRFDVISYLEQEDFISKIKEFIDNQDKYKDNVEYAQDLLREANLDFTDSNSESIVKQLQSYIDDYNNIDSVNHSIFLDYILEANDSVSDDGQTLVVDDKLKNFLFQKLQVEMLQSLMISQSGDLMYYDDDRTAVYDSITGDKLFDLSILSDKCKEMSEEELSKLILHFLADKIINNQRKMILKFGFDDSGFFVTQNGDEIFTEEQKNKILEDLDNIIESLYNITASTVDESLPSNEVKRKGVNAPDDFDGTDVIDDDVTSIDDYKTKVKNDNNDNIDKLRKTLKDSSNKIVKR